MAEQSPQSSPDAPDTAEAPPVIIEDEGVGFDMIGAVRKSKKDDKEMNDFEKMLSKKKRKKKKRKKKKKGKEGKEKGEASKTQEPGKTLK